MRLSPRSRPCHALCSPGLDDSLRDAARENNQGHGEQVLGKLFTRMYHPKPRARPLCAFWGLLMLVSLILYMLYISIIKNNREIGKGRREGSRVHNTIPFLNQMRYIYIYIYQHVNNGPLW